MSEGLQESLLGRNENYFLLLCLVGLLEGEDGGDFLSSAFPR